MCGVLYVFLQSAQWQAQSPTTRPLIFMQLNWPLYITCKVTRQLASNNHCLHQYLPSGYFCWKRSKRNPKHFTFSSLLHGRRTKLIFWSCDSDIKKMISNASPESSKKSTKFAVKESFKI